MKKQNYFSQGRTILGLALVYLAVLLSWDWIWGILFLFWVIPDLITGVTHFISAVSRERSPLLYWAIMATWMLMSVYMIAEPLLPAAWQEDYYAAKSHSSVMAAEEQSQAVLIGTYTDAPDTQWQVHTAATSVPVVEKDTLPYKVFQAEPQYFVGISIETTFHKDQHLRDLEGLWEYFYQDDIAGVIPNIVDERIYVVYSAYDKAGEGSFKALIGYRTSGLEDIYEGLEGLRTPAMEYAVLESEGDAASFVGRAWESVLSSTLDRSLDFDMEVYEMDPDSYKVLSSELRVSIQ